jgi:hypothetical protein
MENRDTTENQNILPPEEGYIILNGRPHYRKIQKDEVKDIPLSNFRAEIIEEIEKDDGIESQRFLSIKGERCENNEPFPTIVIPSSQFNSMRWVMEKWGARAIIEAGKANYLRCAIQTFSKVIKFRRIYTHTGWREEYNGRRIFITANGALGSNKDLQVELEKGLERYFLPLQPENTKEAIEESLKFLEIAPLTITVPIWASMYLAPLNPFLSQDFVLWLYGITGAKKSTLMALALSHYGNFTKDTLPANWESTPNAIEKISFVAKDIPFVIDDFAPQPNTGRAKDLDNTAARIIRSVGNRSGRQRLKSNLKLQKNYAPRGLILATGEQLPSGRSVMARILCVDINSENIDVSKLTNAQNNQCVYPHAMAAYILWIANRWENLKKELPYKWKEKRQEIQTVYQKFSEFHPRLPEIHASLYCAMDLALTFAEEEAKVSHERIEAIKEKCIKALHQVIERQNIQIQDEKPTKYFFETLSELICQNKLHLVRKNVAVSADHKGQLLGWEDGEYIYLLPRMAYHTVFSCAKTEGRYFPVKRNTLYKMLIQEGILIPDGENSTTVIYQDLKAIRVMKIKYNALIKMEKIPDFPPEKKLEEVEA